MTATAAPTHAQNTVSSLRVEVVCLFLDTAEGVLERIMAIMILFPEVNHVSHYVPIVVATLCVALIELASILVSAPAVIVLCLTS